MILLEPWFDVRQSILSTLPIAKMSLSPHGFLKYEESIWKI